MKNLPKNKIELKNVSIEFPGVKALNEINCTFLSGKATAVVGANGAGKSTMMKIISGANPTYTGEVLFNDELVELRDPKSAKQLGIEIVYQEVDTALVSTLSVGENIMIDHIVYGMKGKMKMDWNFIHNSAKEILNQLNVDINTQTTVSSLSLAQKQMVLIARAIRSQCKFLILDEPTSPLSDKEVKKLFELVNQLKAKGVGIIYISHRLNELYDICDDIIVMCNGEIVDTFPLTQSTTLDSIVNLMLGGIGVSKLFKPQINVGEEVLKVQNLSDKENRIQDIELSLHAGEIIGISGLVGAGKTEFCKTLFGAYGKPKGNIFINGKPASINSPAHAVKAGLTMIPEERRKEGILLSEPVFANLSIATLSKFTGFLTFLKHKKEASSAEKKREDLNIVTPSIKQKVAFLSGGNQQKITIGKWLDSSADIYIFDEPTKGIDVGAKNEVYQLIIELARKGKAIIYASSEESEMLTLTDRIYVLYDGSVQKELITSQTNEEELLFYATGGVR